MTFMTFHTIILGYLREGGQCNKGFAMLEPGNGSATCRHLMVHLRALSASAGSQNTQAVTEDASPMGNYVPPFGRNPKPSMQVSILTVKLSIICSHLNTALVLSVDLNALCPLP